jgi:hypothetical protein
MGEGGFCTLVICSLAVTVTSRRYRTSTYILHLSASHLESAVYPIFYKLGGTVSIAGWVGGKNIFKKMCKVTADCHGEFGKTTVLLIFVTWHPFSFSLFLRKLCPNSILLMQLKKFQCFYVHELYVGTV